MPAEKSAIPAVEIEGCLLSGRCDEYIYGNWWGPDQTFLLQRLTPQMRAEDILTHDAYHCEHEMLNPWDVLWKPFPVERRGPLDYVGNRETQALSRRGGAVRFASPAEYEWLLVGAFDEQAPPEDENPGVCPPACRGRQEWRFC